MDHSPFRQTFELVSVYVTRPALNIETDICGVHITLKWVVIYKFYIRTHWLLAGNNKEGLCANLTLCSSHMSDTKNVNIQEKMFKTFFVLI